MPGPLSPAVAARAAATAVGGLAVAIAGLGSFDRGVSALAIPAVLGWAWMGSVLVARRPSHPMGPLLCLIALADAVACTPFAYERHRQLRAPGWLSGGPPALWADTWAWAPAIGLGLVLLLTFPDGRPLSPRWRPALWAALAFIPLSAAGTALLPRAMAGYPGGRAVALSAALGALAAACAVSAAVAAVATVALRWRRADPVARLQMKWFFATLPPTAAGLVTDAFTIGPAGQPVPSILAIGYLAGALMPVAIGVAVLRHRLYDINVLLNRAALYAVLAAALAATYLAVAAAARGLFGERQDLAVQVIATVLAALVLWPLRDPARRRVDRLFYGERGAPYQALARLGRRLEEAGDTESALNSVAKTIADSLRLPYAAVELWLGDGRTLAAAYGQPPPDAAAFPLVAQREQVGRLLAGPRAPGERLGAEDERLLTDLARHAGPAAHAMALRLALDASRAGLVTAREEERRRLRRDLHDELGPALARLTLGLDTALALAPGRPGSDLGDDPRETALTELLGRLTAEARRAVADVRRIVDGLRPPALDELGLAGALRAEAGRLRLQVPGLAIALDVPGDGLRDLPAAVEVACYRIVAEALTNVVRHAHASRCSVRVRRYHGHVHAEVRDDGVGLPDGWRAGVGIGSMRDRVRELCGDLVIEPAFPHGTRIIARLPAGFSRADRDAGPMTAGRVPPDADQGRPSCRGL